IVGEGLLGRHLDGVEAERLVAAVLEAEHRLGGVLQREAFRRREGEAELRMQEAAAAYIAFDRVLAVDEAVEFGEIGRAAAVAAAIAGDARGGILPRRRLCVLHP